MLAIVCYICLIFQTAIHAEDTIFTVDFTKNPSKIWKFWESGTTMDHGYVALRSDWREQLLQVHQDLNIEWVRFHNIFDDDIGIINPNHPTSGYSFINVDKIYDYIHSIGMKPLIELDFMPSSFINTKTNRIGMYEYPVYAGPPNNYTQWYELVKHFVQHLVDRYGEDTVAEWAFDAWNEPNGCCWTDDSHGKKDITTFEKTWNQTTRAVKSISSKFKVGGPGDVAMGWQPEFSQWCHDNKVALDFVSTHMYPTKANAPKTHNGYFEIINELSKNTSKIDPDMNVSLTAYGCTIEKEPNAGPHDTSYNAACFSTFASQFQKLNTDQFFIMSFTGFTDLWDQNGVWSNMFHDGYGWLTNRGIKKPTYHALKLLVDYASDRNYYDVYRNNSNEVNTTLELFTTISSDNKQISLFVMNWMLQGHPIQNESVIIDLVNLNKIYNGNNLPSSATVYRIDDDHCNPLQKWKDIGSPTYPTDKELNIVANSSVLIPEALNVDSKTTNSMRFKIDVPVYGMAVVVVDL